MPEAQSKIYNELSPQQKKVVETFGHGMAVMAGAGAGKTTTLVVKCAELLKQNPEARFAAVSFTEKSAGDLREKLAKNLDLTPHWVMTIHGLCSAVIREFPREAGFDGEETMLSEIQAQLIWERAIESLWSEELPDVCQSSLESLLDREGRTGVFSLLKRIQSLETFGVIESLEQAHDGAAQELVVLARYVLERYERIKRRQGVLDFNDLEKGARLALKHERVREVYRKRFDLVLIDEFQDTNPVQAEIITKFVRSDFSNLCVVGDPKQSIYRFRDADLSIFEDFCVKLPEKHSLTWNFRSRPGIIDFTNEVCGPIFPVSEMNYEPLVAKREKAAETPVVRLDVENPDDLAKFILSQSDRGLENFALLLRKIRGAEKWLKSLTSAGVSIAVGSGGFFWEDPRVREMIAFLRWWDNPANSLSGAVFLRAPWCGVSDQEIDDWVKEDPTFVAPFFRSDYVLARALKSMRDRALGPAQLLSELLITPEIEAELGAAYLGLWHRAEDISSRGLDFHSAVSELSTAVDQNRREREVPPPRNVGQLQVLTLHSSKGLEFDHVILIDFAGKTRAANAPLLFWDRYQGAFLGARDEDGERDRDVEKTWRELEKKKDLAESKRLFYVALTRARERLILVCPPEKVSKTEKEPEASPTVYKDVASEDNWRGWIERVSIEKAELKSISKASQATLKNEWRRTPNKNSARSVRPRHSVTEWSVLSTCPQKYFWTYIQPPAQGNFQDQKIFEFSLTENQGVTQRELGTRVHACLEKMDFPSLELLEHEVGSDRLNSKTLIDWAKTSDLMKSAKRSWSELAFEIPVGSEILVGAIDRLFEVENGFHLVDFKVTQKEKDPRALLETYQTQMELYAHAISRLAGAKKPIRAALVAISPRKVQEIEVSLGGIALDALSQLAAKIVSKGESTPTPSSACATCEFREQCPAKI